MNLLCVSSLDRHEGELMGYNAVGSKLVYLTDRDINVVKLGGKFGKESATVRGELVVNFVVSKRGYIALLYRNRSVQMRRMDRLGEVCHKFNNVMLMLQEGYPKLKWDYEQLYLLYPDSIEILSMKDRTRRGYTDIVVDYPGQRIMDMVICNVMDSQRAVLLQLRNYLLLTIIPIPVTQLSIPNINQTLNLCSMSSQMDSRREYVVVLCENSHLKVYNLVSLKQIAEVELALKAGELAEIEADINCECLLVRVVSQSTLDITRNYIYKINSWAYYAETANYFSQEQPFFLYRLEITIKQNLTIFPVSEEKLDNQTFDSYHFSFFKQKELYLAQQLVPRGYTQSLKEMGCKMGCFEWQQVVEWKDIITSYLQITSHSATHQQKMMGLSEQERQIYEYNLLKQDFDGIVSRFMEKMEQESQGKPISQHDMEKQWGSYLAKIAKQRNFILETIELFKQQSLALFGKQQESAQISLELQQCLRDIEGRGGRIDARISERKKELEDDRRKQEELKKKDMACIQKEAKTKPKVTPQQIQKYQQEYQQFVADFLAQKQKKQYQEANQKKYCSLPSAQQDQAQRFVLALPILSQSEKKRIQQQLLPIQDLNIQNQQPNINFDAEKLKADIELQKTLQSIEQCLQPLTQKLQNFIDRLAVIQRDQLTEINKSDQLITQRNSIDLQFVVKSSCRKMLSSLSSRVRQGIESTTHKIQQLEERNMKYYQQTLGHFKEYIKLQMDNRVDLFYRSRKQLQVKLSRMIKQQKQGQSTAS